MARGRRKKPKVQIQNKSALLTGSLLSDFLTLDPIEFVQRTMTVDGRPFQLMDCGRDYLYEIYRYICLEAIGPTGKPVIIKKGRQVEMTTTASCISLYLACSGALDHVRGLHAFPQIEQARRYANVAFKQRVYESIGGSLFKKLEGDGSVTQKTFKDGNFILIEGAGLEGDRLRGIPLDYVLFDEVQDLSRTARENTLEALSHSKLGMAGTGLEMDFGTPKEVGSEFHILWTESDQRYYHLKCPHCGKFVPLWYKYNTNKTVEGTNLIEGFMVRCQDLEGNGCGKLMDKRQAVKGGKWVPQNPNGKWRGYHIDQLLVPHITREAIDKKLQERTIRNFQNEVMGEFYTGHDTGLTWVEALRATTTDPDTRDWTFSTVVNDRMTWAGIDWGQRISGEDDEGTGGYSVFVVISRLPGNKFKLEFAKRLGQKKVTSAVDDNTQIEEIKRWIRLYNCKFVAVDHGAGHVQNQLLEEAFPDKVRRVYSTAGTKNTYRFDPKSKIITIDKHKAFEETYDLIRDRAFAFPYQSPEDVEWLIEHITNVEVVTKALQNGTSRKVYQKQGPAKPIDGAAALVYAYIAYKFQQSSGFSDTHQNDYAQGRNMPTPSGASIKPVGKMTTKARGGVRKW